MGRLMNFTLVKLDNVKIDRWLIIDFLIALSCVFLLLYILKQAHIEKSYTNSYAALADAFIHGKLFVDRCFDGDCATFEGKSWVVFPPLPAIITMPFVALFGLKFKGFIIISTLCAAASGFLWFKIFRNFGMGKRNATLLTLVISFGTPVWFVVRTGDQIWFFAQAIAFLCVTAAFYQALARRMLWAGLFLGLAILSRQFTVLLAPFIFYLSYEPSRQILQFDRTIIRRALLFAAPIAISLFVYFMYNYVRFGHALETGYKYLFVDMPADQRTVVANRLVEHGLFSAEYFFHNAMYFFFQGFHIEFTGKTVTTVSGLDPYGTSIFAASPFLILILFLKMNKVNFIGCATIALMATVMLFYFSNGWIQHNTQRYTLDWLPVLFALLPPVLITQDRMNMFRILGGISIALNVMTVLTIMIIHHN